MRRARSFSLEGKGAWVNQSLVMRADALDNASHPSWTPEIPPIDYYGATPWLVELGGGSRLYFMAAMRYWHWGPGQAHQPGGSREIPGTKDIALAVSRDGSDFELVGGRLPIARPTRDGTAGSRTVWLMPPGPIRVGDEELYFLGRSNVAEGVGEIVDPQSTDGYGWRPPALAARTSQHKLRTPIPGTLRSNLTAGGRARLWSLARGSTGWSRSMRRTPPQRRPPWCARGCSPFEVRPVLRADLRADLQRGPSECEIRRVAGTRLVLNLDASGPGSLTVEVLGAANQTLATSVPSVSNSLRFEVAWQPARRRSLLLEGVGGGTRRIFSAAGRAPAEDGGRSVLVSPRAQGSTPLAQLAGTPVRVLLKMQACKLFSLGFAE